MIKTVIFDLDGTLIDSAPDLMSALNFALEKRGYPTHALEGICAMLGHGLYNLVKKAMPESAREDKELFNQVVSDYRQFYEDNLVTASQPYEGVYKVLAQLKEKEIQLGVLSNKQNAAVQELTNHFFPDTFSFIQGQVEGVPTKPDPFSLVTMIQDLGFLPEEALYVGDMLVDYKTSQAGGTKFAFASWGYGAMEDSYLKSSNIRLEKPLDLLDLSIVMD